MTYQVLARKWRPQTFQEVVGQQHVLRALVNALDSGRLHHAYLFTGTRGVGKTSIARILAKCFNCDEGVSSKPCGQCGACKEIEQGRFIDLIEIDAASRTKVEDTRDLLNTVQYAPTRGRYKVYLIDEVHMLSTHSFNALLKTLEEPPAGVIFILATTDPQRLPMTVLSRCLQFQLKALSVSSIVSQLEKLLKEEQIAFELPALQQLASAASGSMRDALSLLDQAVAYGQNTITVSGVSEMLGTLESAHLIHILEALDAHDGCALLTIVAELAEESADFGNVLEGLLSLLHDIAVGQAVPESASSIFGSGEELKALGNRVSREDIQLYYQIGLVGRRDLPLAPSPREGFEMVLLRMLAFSPAQPVSPSLQVPEKKLKESPAAALPQTVAVKVPTEAPVKAIEFSEPLAEPSNDWHHIFPQLNLTGMAKVAASYCVLPSKEGSLVRLAIQKEQALLLNERQEQQIAAALSEYYGDPVKVKIEVSDGGVDSPAARASIQAGKAQAQANQAVIGDGQVQALLHRFDAKLNTDSIKPR